MARWREIARETERLSTSNYYIAYQEDEGFNDTLKAQFKGLTSTWLTFSAPQ